MFSKLLRAPLVLVLAVLASGFLVTTTSASPAEAAQSGRVCLFQDEEGAGKAGHVAWAIRNPKNSNHWIWGETPNPSGSAYIPPGGSNGSWIRGGTWTQLRQSISTAKFDRYRCIDTAGGNLKAAQATYLKTKNSGYDLLTNNCLTHSLEIFRSYSPALSSAHLPSGLYKAPNYYFTTTLNNTRGWERARSY